MALASIERENRSIFIEDLNDNIASHEFNPGYLQAYCKQIIKAFPGQDTSAKILNIVKQQDAVDIDAAREALRPKISKMEAQRS